MYNHFLGKSFYIILFPHHMTSKYLGVQLKNPYSFFLKHRFTIIDHISSKGDLSSQLLGDEKNFAKMYRVAQERIENQNFIYDNVLIVKLTVVLR